MPPVPNKGDLVATWTYLEAGLHRVMYDFREGMDMRTYMNIYTAVHNFCTSQSSPDLMDQKVQGENLYTKLKEYLTKHLTELHENSKSHVDENLTGFYARKWAQYATAAVHVNDLFRYLNRHWVKRVVHSGEKGTYDVYTLYHVQWRKELFPKLHANVMAGVLKMVEKQRNGEIIDHSQIKTIVDSFIALRLCEANTTRPTPDVYRHHFEKPFLEATARYYEIKSARFLAENSVVEYMNKAFTWMDEEKMRVELYLGPEIMDPLMKACIRVLVTSHSDLLQEEFQVLLESDRQNDISLMYRLLILTEDGLEPLRARFEAYVSKSGQDVIENLAAEEKFEPKTYIDTLFEMHAQYQKLINNAFFEDFAFVRTLDTACKEFVNRNKVCDKGSARSAELLAKYTDTLLKKGAEEDNLEVSLFHAITIFKYIEDKDMFATFYSRMLAKRLVNSSSASDDAESSMISKLKEACGFEYTNKLQRMVQDIKVCRDLNSSYKDLQRQDEHDVTKEIDASYYVLNTGFWPLTPPKTAFIPPPEIAKAGTNFQAFYLDKHNGRKLTWLWNLCKGELRANYLKTSKIPYSFTVSAYQMGILLLFNEAEVVTYEDIQKATTLDAEWLDPSLSALLKAKVLKSRPESGKPGPGTSYTLNYGFKSKRVKVNLNITIKVDQKKDAEDAQGSIDEYRKYFLQTTIVRIMKSRQKMKYVELVQEILAQVSLRFTPKIPDVKRTIDQLVDKEYLERVENQELQYVA